MTEQEFEPLVKEAINRLSRYHDIEIVYDHMFQFGQTGYNGTYLLIFRDPHLLGGFQTEPGICDTFNSGTSNTQQRSVELGLHIRDHIIETDRKAYYMNVETRLPYGSLTQQKVTPLNGSHYNEFVFEDAPEGVNLNPKEKIVVRIAWCIGKAYKYGNDEINAMVADITK